MELSQNKLSLAAKCLITAIRIYRLTLSPLFGNSCRYYPTCSSYMEDAIKQYGAYHGSVYGTKRLLRCHPWHKGGYDPVPQKPRGSL